MTWLEAADYDRAETEGAARLPNRIVECCQPVAFRHEGYPTRVHSASALHRYVDVMHEGRLASTFADILAGGLTPAELDLVTRLARTVHALSAERYGRPVVPKGAVARALNVVRHVQLLYPERGAVVLELGAGSGYVGALLMLAGYRYVATDIAQAFYLFQNHLLNAVAPGKVVELANDPRVFADVASVPEGGALHVPWWKFVVPEPVLPLAVDVVTANHCLCEMHPRALAYSLRAGAAMLRHRAPASCFLFEGWGSTVLNPIASVHRRFSALGYVIAHNDTLASVYVQDDSPWALNGPGHPRPPAPAAAPAAPRIGPLQRLLGRKAETNAAPPAATDPYHPPIWITPANPVSNALVEGRARIAAAATASIEDLLAALRSVLGADDLATDDERFLRYVDSAL